MKYLSMKNTMWLLFALLAISLAQDTDLTPAASEPVPAATEDPTNNEPALDENGDLTRLASKPIFGQKTCPPVGGWWTYWVQYGDFANCGYAGYAAYSQCRSFPFFKSIKCSQCKSDVKYDGAVYDEAPEIIVGYDELPNDYVLESQKRKCILRHYCCPLIWRQP